MITEFFIWFWSWTFGAAYPRILTFLLILLDVIHLQIQK